MTVNVLSYPSIERSLADLSGAIGGIETSSNNIDTFKNGDDDLRMDKRRFNKAWFRPPILSGRQNFRHISSPALSSSYELKPKFDEPQQPKFRSFGLRYKNRPKKALLRFPPSLISENLLPTPPIASMREYPFLPEYPLVEGKRWFIAGNKRSDDLDKDQAETENENLNIPIHNEMHPINVESKSSENDGGKPISNILPIVLKNENDRKRRTSTFTR